MAVCQGCGRENPKGFRFCGFCTAPLDQTAAPVTEERKVISVLFCDLVGFTARSDEADPEDVRARLRPFHGRLRHEIERFGGTVEIGSLPDEAFARPGAAQRLLGSGQRAKGGTQLQRALALFRQVGATAYLRQGAALDGA